MPSSRMPRERGVPPAHLSGMHLGCEGHASVRYLWSLLGGLVFTALEGGGASCLYSRRNSRKGPAQHATLYILKTELHLEARPQCRLPALVRAVVRRASNGDGICCSPPRGAEAETRSSTRFNFPGHWSTSPQHWQLSCELEHAGCSAVE